MSSKYILVECPNCLSEFVSDNLHTTCECGCEFDEYGTFDITVECPKCYEEYSRLYDEFCPRCSGGDYE